MANFHSIVILAIIAGAALLPEAYGRPGCEYIADLLDTMKVCNTNSPTEQCCSVRVPVVRMLEALQFSYLLNYSDICDCIRGVNDGIRSLAKCPGGRAEQVDGVLGTIGTACAAGQTSCFLRAGRQIDRLRLNAKVRVKGPQDRWRKPEGMQEEITGTMFSSASRSVRLFVCLCLSYALLLCAAVVGL